MSTAPQVGSQSEHDWLVVGTTIPPSHVAPSTTWQQWLDALTAALRNLSDRSTKIFRDACAASGVAGIALLHKVREQSFPNLLPALGHRLAGVGNHAHSIWRWLCKREFTWLRAHPIVAMFALGTIFPLAYLIYCIATVPSDGGLVIEPTPSALVVEAADGQVFATRGVFKGDKLSAQKTCPRTCRTQSLPSRIGIFMSTAGSIYPLCCARRFATFVRAARAKAEARSRSSSRA